MSSRSSTSTSRLLSSSSITGQRVRYRGGDYDDEKERYATGRWTRNILRSSNREMMNTDPPTKACLALGSVPSGSSFSRWSADGVETGHAIASWAQNCVQPPDGSLSVCARPGAISKPAKPRRMRWVDVKSGVARQT